MSRMSKLMSYNHPHKVGLNAQAKHLLVGQVVTKQDTRLAPRNARSLTKEMRYPLPHIPDIIQDNVSVKCHRVNTPSAYKWCSTQVMKSIDAVLQLSQGYGMPVSEPGILVVEFILSIVWQLLDATLDDEGLLELTSDKKSKWIIKSQEMEIDRNNSFDEKRAELRERLQNLNTVMAIELVGEFLQNKVTARILYLARRNMPSHWLDFIQRLQLLQANSSALRNSKTLTPESLQQLTSDARIVLSRECKTSSLQKFHAVMAFGSLSSSAGLCQGASRSALWLPLDLLLEDAMDGYQVNATCGIEIITGLIKTLQAINGTTWHDTFLERAWSHAMEKRQLPDGPNSRQRIYLIGRQRKAVKWATLFAQLCAIKGDSRTSLEAEAYASYMKGNLLFEQDQNWDTALMNFKSARAVYEELGKYGDLENQVLCRERVEELQPSIHYCLHRFRWLSNGCLLRYDISI